MFAARIVMLFAALAAIGAAPAGASTTVAMTSDATGRHLVVTGDESPNGIVLRYWSSPDLRSAYYYISDRTRTTTDPIRLAPGSAGCVSDGQFDVECALYSGTQPDLLNITTVRILAGGGDDHVDVTADGAPDVDVLGEAGDDMLKSGSRGTLDGGDGDDTLSGSLTPVELLGGPGNDVLLGSPYIDTLDGGPGADRLASGPDDDFVTSRDDDADHVDCGTGADSAKADFRDAVVKCEVTETTGPPDADGDGVPVPVDCNDGDAAVRPGQNEVPGNGRDDDCVGGDAKPTAVVKATLVSGFAVRSSYTRITALQLRDVEAGVRVQLRCGGRGCPFKARTVRQLARRKGSLRSYVRGARFRRGSRLEVRVTKSGTVGKSVLISFQAGKRPSARLRCLPPGAKRPKSC